jgi:methylmalonyl-CoA mutase cobalamin-binding domain/chain
MGSTRSSESQHCASLASVLCLLCLPQAAGHGTLVPSLMEELRKQGMEHVLVVCGGIIPTQVRRGVRCGSGAHAL